MTAIAPLAHELLVRVGAAWLLAAVLLAVLYLRRLR